MTTTQQARFDLRLWAAGKAEPDDLEHILKYLRVGHLTDAMEECQNQRERIKHTSHKDGLGMGDQAMECGCRNCENAIRRMIETGAK